MLVNILRKILFKTGLCSGKILGRSRTGGAAALSRELSEFFGPKLFSCNAKAPSEKISQTAMRIVRGRLLVPTPIPSPGEMGSRPRIPRPAAVRECKRVIPNCHQIPPIKPQWGFVSDTFFVVVGDLSFLAMKPSPAAGLGPPPWGGPMGPLLRRTHGKKIECVCMPDTLLTP